MVLTRKLPNSEKDTGASVLLCGSLSQSSFGFVLEHLQGPLKHLLQEVPRPRLVSQ